MGQSSISTMLSSEIDTLISSTTTIVFSKSYCPYCNSTKSLLKSKGIEFTAIELDQRDDGDAIQNYLAKKTGQRTVPNIFIKGEHIGGNSELVALDRRGGL
jgi:glutaredoxin 3